MAKGGLDAAVAAFGAAAKAKLANPAATGDPEDQLRAPLEALFAALAALAGHLTGQVVLTGEVTLADRRSRPDYAVAVNRALAGFIEVKAPGKGADPRRFTDRHDKAQWARLQSLPNLLYTDGECFALWRDGALVAQARLSAPPGEAGARAMAGTDLLALVGDFLSWQPIPPRDVPALAAITARLCRLLRDEVTERLAAGDAAFADLATDWRKLLFPQATDAEFADGYAQAVTFGLLIARAQGIALEGGIEAAARALGRSSTLIGRALSLLTDSEANQAALATSLGTMLRVLAVVDWPTLERGRPETWLYFYEDFLALYDNALRKRTGSYYTPPEVVAAMVRLVDEALRDPAWFDLPRGLAEPAVTVVDGALGTGTFLLGAMARIAAMVGAEQGPGAVPAAVRAALPRLIGFEMQFGPFAVAQLRLVAEAARLLGLNAPDPRLSPRLHVTDTLGDPAADSDYLPAILKPIAESRREANRIKREERVTVVLGNPPYKEKAKGRGAWVEKALLADWVPPPDWGVSAHAKHLRNLYVYFWRWAARMVFGREADAHGLVCFITVAGFLNGPGFQRMRAELRAQSDAIWVVDCSPEGHQPEVPTRIFEGVQQPVCIVLALRRAGHAPGAPAPVRFRRLPAGPRAAKFAALEAVRLDGPGWQEAPAEERAPFLPEAGGAWGGWPGLEQLFAWNGSGVMPGRTWVIAPDAESLERRWAALLAERDPARKEVLFHPHGSPEAPGDRHTRRLVTAMLHGHPHPAVPVAQATGKAARPIRYGFRSFDRQWIIPDNRLINRPNPTLWQWHGTGQVYLTALCAHAPDAGPALTFTELMPDLHHYKGSFGGRVFPLLGAGGAPNIAPGVLGALGAALGRAVTGDEVLAVLAAVAAHPAYTARFRAELVQPGLRLPIPTDPALFAEAAALGREVIWLHCFGTRCADAAAGRPPGPPRLPPGEAPFIPEGGAITGMPERLRHAGTTLHLGTGRVERVPAAVAAYEVSGMVVLDQWFSYRRRDRSRPIIGDRRPPSPLGLIQPEEWPAAYTTDLLDLLHVLGRLVALEGRQATLLARICAGPTLAAASLSAGVAAARARATDARQGGLDL